MSDTTKPVRKRKKKTLSREQMKEAIQTYVRDETKGDELKGEVFSVFFNALIGTDNLSFEYKTVTNDDGSVVINIDGKAI